MFREYKVIRVVEGEVANTLVGSANLPIEKIQKILNDEAKQGWQLVFQCVDQTWGWFARSRQAIVLTMGRY